MAVLISQRLGAPDRPQLFHDLVKKTPIFPMAFPAFVKKMALAACCSQAGMDAASQMPEGVPLFLWRFPPLLVQRTPPFYDQLPGKVGSRRNVSLKQLTFR